MFTFRRSSLGAVLWLALILVGGCEVHLGPLPGAGSGAGGQQDAGGEVSGEVWVYTSIYQGVIEELEVLIKTAHPNLTVKWYRAGSEVVARRLSSELRAGGTQADLVMTSDPFWYVRLKKEGHLTPYVTTDVLPIPKRFMDTDGYFVTCRLSSMVIAYHPEMIGEGEVPRSFEALIDPKYDGKVTLGDPLSSGTHFTTLAFLSDRYGWTFYETLRAHKAVASGGNSSVMRRVEGREYPIGVVLLENVLANKEKGSPVKYIVPEDGLITIPGPVGILSSTDNPVGARAIYDLMMSKAGQEAMVKGRMHSANPSIDAPAGAPPFSALESSKFEWGTAFMEKIEESAPALKSRFDKTMNR